ncbi:uncharacterized protein TRIADDRAFT_59521 [Trichoplax adhaerens]|uniref:General transcription factor IIF subunit 2 n=1 Tax=Trichoplax adhaerens TaxID=10228 RepID=B3S5M8_TRIAD|nr:hypothetical protein TRIADDRAFT_59521 [Trichoplax adhaerens]EDV21870.1 hypothetical protein TRIADDRAFT_59521 [Trichoplax adhaerens]|eukprot:XP_002115507.1 hypothetical protein TRIADDRAFT_59521 [Trichoplax adhaerens]
MDDGKESVDVSSADQSVWLLKVPKFVSQAWQKSESGKVGSVKIQKKGPNEEMLFLLENSLTTATSSGEANIPTEYKLVSNECGQYQVALKRSLSIDNAADSSTEPEIVGKVVRKIDLRALNERMYLNLKRRKTELAKSPRRQPKFLSQVVNTYRPVSDHVELRVPVQKKEEGKRARADRDHVKEMLFAAFEKHQYYSLKSLADITQQPVMYLKGIMHEIGQFNTKEKRYRNLWELKPEYRHYSSSKKGQDDVGKSN